MRVEAQNCEKFTKTPYFGGLTSFKVIDVDSFRKLATGACYNSMSVPICNRFHTGWAYSGKIITFYSGYPLSRLYSRRTRLPSSRKFCHKKTRVLGAAHSENFMTSACTVLIQYSIVMYRWTDRCSGHSWDTWSILLSHVIKVESNSISCIFLYLLAWKY